MLQQEQMFLVWQLALLRSGSHLGARCHGQGGRKTTMGWEGRQYDHGSCGNRCGTSTACTFISAWTCSQFVACADALALVLCVLQDGHGSYVWLQVLQRCATDPDALCSLAQQLAKQGARHEQLIARLQEQLSEQRQQYTSMQAGLQRQLQELHAEVQQLRQ